MMTICVNVYPLTDRRTQAGHVQHPDWTFIQNTETFKSSSSGFILRSFRLLTILKYISDGDVWIILMSKLSTFMQLIQASKLFWEIVGYVLLCKYIGQKKKSLLWILLRFYYGPIQIS